MSEVPFEPDLIDFGDLPEEINSLLQQGVKAYRQDQGQADRLFRKALEIDPSELATYFCLYKIHTYQGNLDQALQAAEAGLLEATAQAGWDRDWRNWQMRRAPTDGPGRFALYTLKALAFIHLRKDDPETASAMLQALRVFDPSGSTGWTVIAALAEGLTPASPGPAPTAGIPLA